MIAEGNVLVTPPESPEIYCLDLHSGKLVWHRRQGDSLFIGGVDHGNVLLVGGQSVIARRLSDGEPAWEKETLPLPSGVLPAGQGYLSDGRYYLPLTSGQIAEIDMAAGKLATFSPAGSNVALGNLICYRGSVISQSPLVVDKFEQLDVLRKRTEVALARNANDAIAIRESAELKRADNQKPEAVRLLKRAYELAPDDLVTQEMLAELLLEELADDYATYPRRCAARLQADSQPRAANRTAPARCGRPGQLRPTPGRVGCVSAARRFHRRRACLPADRRPIRRSQRPLDFRPARGDVVGRLGRRAQDPSKKSWPPADPILKNPRTAAELRHYLAHLEQLPGADEVRLALATYLIDHDRPQEAEIELLQSLASKEQAVSIRRRRIAGEAVRQNRQASRSPDHRAGRADMSTPNSRTSTAPPQPRDRQGNVPNQGQPPAYRQLRIEQDFLPQAVADALVHFQRLQRDCRPQSTWVPTYSI